MSLAELNFAAAATEPMMKKSKRGSSKIYWPRVRKPLSVTIGYGKLAYNCTAALDRILCRRVNASTQQH